MMSFSSLVFAQKKPTIMIVPSNNWCNQRYYVQTYDDAGMEITIPDYSLAFNQDPELGGVISKIGELLTSEGYSLKDCEQELKNISLRSAEDGVTFSSSSSATIVESPLDELKRRAKADIIIQVGWQVYKESTGNSITFTLEAFDSYSSKRIATATGTGDASTSIIPRQLENAIKNQIPAFSRQMDEFFNRLISFGREIVLFVRCWENSSVTLETEFGGDELIDCIQDYLAEHCVGGQFNLSDASENFAQFEQVMIPLQDENGRATDARSFVTGLRKYLQNHPYNIASKVIIRGLGEANLILGEK